MSAFSYRGQHRGGGSGRSLTSKPSGARASRCRRTWSEQSSAKELIDAAIGELGQIDILVNNAGITRDDLIMRMKPEDWTDVIDDQPVGCVLDHQGRDATHDEGTQPSHHQHHQRQRPGRADRPDQLLLGQGGPHRADQGHGS